MGRPRNVQGLILVWKQELHHPPLAELLPKDQYYLADLLLADDFPDDVGEVIQGLLLASRGRAWIDRGMAPLGEGDVVAVRGASYILVENKRRHTPIPGCRTLEYKEHTRWRTPTTRSGCTRSSR